MSAYKPRILVIDDEPQMHRFLGPALGAAGFEALRADTGEAGLRAIAAASPDAVVLDLGLPDMDGKDLLRAARAFYAGPVIVLSAREREAEKIATLDLGADDYVQKPFGVGEFLARLRVALRHKLERVGAEAVIQAGELETRPGQAPGQPGRRAGAALAEGVRTTGAAGRGRRQGADPPRPADRDLGPGARRGPALPAGPGRPTAPEARSRARRAQAHPDRAGGRLPLHAVRSPSPSREGQLAKRAGWGSRRRAKTLGEIVVTSNSPARPPLRGSTLPMEGREAALPLHQLRQHPAGLGRVHEHLASDRVAGPGSPTSRTPFSRSSARVLSRSSTFIATRCTPSPRSASRLAIGPSSPRFDTSST